MSEIETIRLLIIDDSQNDAEKLISILRNAGHATRAHRVTSDEDLEETLKEHTWDLFLCKQESTEVTVETALSQLKQLALDIPFIVLIPELDGIDICNGLLLGATHVIPDDESDWLLTIVRRELDNLSARRSRITAEIAVRETEQRCQLLLDSSRDAIAYVTDGMHIYANLTYVQLFGYDDAEELEGMPIIDMVGSEYQTELKDLLKKNPEDDSQEFLCNGIRCDNTNFQAAIKFSPAEYDGEECTQVIIRLETGDEELQEKLKEATSQDALTGLSNRQHFLDELSSAVDKTNDDQGDAALLYIHLDNFNQIRTNEGISGADAIISNIAGLIKDNSEEEHIISRFGEDIFTLLAADTNLRDIENLANTLRIKIEEHMTDVNDHTVQTTASIGIAVIDKKTPSAQDALNFAHQAADDVDGGNGMRVYEVALDPEDQENIVEKFQRSVDEGRFKLLYQPIISLRGEGGEHYEILLRMLDDNNNEINPADFLDTAHQSGFSGKLDRWVILQTIKTLAGHVAKGHDTKIYINITADSLRDESFVPWMAKAIQASGLPAQNLILQFNEHDASTYLKQAITFTEGLNKLECSACITQFGSGVNPFNILKHLKLNYVKLAGSFTQNLKSSKEDQDTLKEMVSSLHQHGKLTIVPFVESASVLSTLWQAGVNYIQGYYLQAPSEQMNYDFNDDN